MLPPVTSVAGVDFPSPETSTALAPYQPGPGVGVDGLPEYYVPSYSEHLGLGNESVYRSRLGLGEDSVSSTYRVPKPPLTGYIVGGAVSGAILGLIGAAVYGAVKDIKPNYTNGAGYGAMIFAGLGVVTWATKSDVEVTRTVSKP